MGLPLQNHTVARQVMSRDKLLTTARKQAKMGLSSSFLLVVNNRQGRLLLYDWWRQVDDFPDTISTDGKTRYAQYRNGGMREVSMLNELISQG